MANALCKKCGEELKGFDTFEGGQYLRCPKCGTYFKATISMVNLKVVLKEVSPREVEINTWSKIRAGGKCDP